MNGLKTDDILLRKAEINNLTKLGNLQAAKEQCLQICNSQQADAESWYLLAGIHGALGDFREAESSCRTALSLKNDFPEAHYRLGNALNAQGRLDEAIKSFECAISLNPDYVDAYNNIGLAYFSKGDIDASIASFEQGLEYETEDADLHTNLALSLIAKKRHDEAIAHLKQAIRTKPDLVLALVSLAKICADNNQYDEALEYYARLIKQVPANPDILHGMAEVYEQMGNIDAAIDHYKQALEIDPDNIDALNDTGLLLMDTGHFSEAVNYLRQAKKLQPENALVLHNLGIALKLNNEIEQAITTHQQALAIQENSTGYTNLGLALVEKNKLKEAEDCFRKAIDLDSRNSEAKWSLGLTRLLNGNFQDGWEDYEYRWQRPGKEIRDFDQPRWKGESLTGQSILIHTEQGFGDTFQFIRYIPLLKQKGANIIVECQPEVYRLLETCPGIDLLVMRGEPLPEFDTYLPIASLPRVFNTGLTTIPAEVPYLSVPDGDYAEIQSLVSEGKNTIKIGIVWAGSPTHAQDHKRSCTLACFKKLADIPGVALYSLQKGKADAAIDACGFDLTDLGSHLQDFSDTAAAIDKLDLIITVDTSVAHLTGALGKPVWVLLPFAPDWRWLLDRDDSPWYPTMRLFRQGSPGDWAGVFDKIRTELACFVDGSA